MAKNVRPGLRSLRPMGIAANAAAAGDFRLSNKGGPFLDHETRRLEIALQGAARLQFTPFAHRDVALHFAVDRNGLGFNLAANIGVLANGEDAIGMNLALDFSIDQKFLLKLN